MTPRVAQRDPKGRPKGAKSPLFGTPVGRRVAPSPLECHMVPFGEDLGWFGGDLWGGFLEKCDHFALLSIPRLQQKCGSFMLLAIDYPRQHGPDESPGQSPGAGHLL
jgi:hypothetical protein